MRTAISISLALLLAACASQPCLGATQESAQEAAEAFGELRAEVKEAIVNLLAQLQGGETLRLTVAGKTVAFWADGDEVKVGYPPSHYKSAVVCPTGLRLDLGPIAAAAPRQFADVIEQEDMVTWSFRGEGADVGWLTWDGQVGVGSHREVTSLAKKDVLWNELNEALLMISGVSVDLKESVVPWLANLHARFYLSNPNDYYRAIAVIPAMNQPPAEVWGARSGGGGAGPLPGMANEHDVRITVPKCRIRDARLSWNNLNYIYSTFDGKKFAGGGGLAGTPTGSIQLEKALTYGDHVLHMTGAGSAAIIEAVYSPEDDKIVTAMPAAPSCMIVTPVEPIDKIFPTVGGGPRNIEQ
jgi:hypothetical protein